MGKVPKKMRTTDTLPTPPPPTQTYWPDATTLAALNQRQDEIAIGLERCGAAFGAYSLAWRARQHLRGFFAAVIVLGAVVVLTWMVADRSTRQGVHTLAGVEAVMQENTDLAARMAVLEARSAVAPPPVIVVPAEDAPAPEPVEGAPQGSSSDADETLESAETPATPTIPAASSHLPAATPAKPAETVTRARLIDVCALGVCVQLG